MRIGAYQFAVSGNVNENYNEIEKAIYLAKHKDVQLLIFPECSLTLCSQCVIDFNRYLTKMIFLLLSEPYLKKKKYIIEHCCFSLINKSSLMTSVLYGDGIMIISQKGIVMEYLR